MYATVQIELGELNDLKNYRSLHQRLGKVYGPYLSDRLDKQIHLIDQAIEWQARRAIPIIEEVMAKQQSDSSLYSPQEDGKSNPTLAFEHNMPAPQRSDLVNGSRS